jgi:predicted ATPase
VTAYRLLGLRNKPEPRHSVGRLDRPLIGRERESTLLSQSVSDLQSGRGAIVCLIGEAGLGKSRLIAEQRSAWTGHPSRWLECRAASYDTSRAYGQFRQLTARLLEVAEGDAPESTRDRIRGALDLSPPDRRAAWVEAFEALLGVEAPQELQSGATQARPAAGGPLEGEALKRALFDASMAVWRRWATAPAVVVLDDLHWGDAASIALLRHLFQLVAELPLLFLCAFRPDRRAPAWQIRRGVGGRDGVPYRQIALRPLSAEASERLVDALLGGVEQRPGLRERILARAEGSPLFLEEVVRALREGGSDDLAIPENVRALLVARIDRLEEGARRALQQASVVGRTFARSVLESIWDGAFNLDGPLEALLRAELIHATRQGPEATYVFHHPLTCDAAYGSMLLRRRREIHRRVGEAIERLFPERRAEQAAVLGHHFDAGGDPRAERYLTTAGDAAERLYAPCRGGRALHPCDQMGATASGRRRAALSRRHGAAAPVQSARTSARVVRQVRRRPGQLRGDGGAG